MVLILRLNGTGMCGGYPGGYPGAYPGAYPGVYIGGVTTVYIGGILQALNIGCLTAFLSFRWYKS